MKKVIRLTESDLTRIVRRVIKENEKSKGFINEFWPFTKRKKQLDPEPEEEVYKSTEPPREIVIDLEQVPGFFDLQWDSRPDETKVSLRGDGNPVYLGFKETFAFDNGRPLEFGKKYYVQYIKDTNSIKVYGDCCYHIGGDSRRFIHDRRMEYPKFPQHELANLQKYDKSPFEKGDNVRGIDILDVRNY